MKLNFVLPVLGLLTLIAAPARAQGWTVYDASLGTLPPAQGWTLTEDINPPVAYESAVVGDDLHLSTLAFGNNVPPNNGGGVWWSRTDVSLDFAGDFVVEARIRIASAPNHAVNPDLGWPRPGYTLAVYDVNGRLFWIGLGSGEVFLSNTAYGTYNSVNTVHTAFNTADAHHVYRIERAAGGTGAALRIDGVVRLELPVLGAGENAGGLIYFGDPTYWANSESYTSWVRYIPDVSSVADPIRQESLWAKALASPARNLRVAFSSHANGRLSLEVFDAAGRRIERLEREVAAGENGIFDSAYELPAGVYFYRVCLAGPPGGSSGASGRIVILR